MARGRRTDRPPPESDLSLPLEGIPPVAVPQAGDSDKLPAPPGRTARSGGQADSGATLLDDHLRPGAPGATDGPEGTRLGARRPRARSAAAA